MTALLLAAALTCAAPDVSRELHGGDKVLHAGATGALALAGYGAASVLDAPLALRLGAGAALGVTAGLGKELMDLAGFGTPSVGDLVFDALGVGAGLGLALAVDALVPEAPDERATR